jgi:hypothetical protein
VHAGTDFQATGEPSSKPTDELDLSLSTQRASGLFRKLRIVRIPQEISIYQARHRELKASEFYQIPGMLPISGQFNSKEQ